MRILVLTETDACCGPMAAAFLHDYSPFHEVVSAGRNALESIDPMIVMVMKECLVDLSEYHPQNACKYDPKDFDKVYECPDLSCPKDVDECRRLRDFVKNEAYLFFRKL